ERYGAPGMPARLFYMYIPAEMFRLANPQRGAPPLLFPQAKYFTVQVPFTPADLEAAKKALACHGTQFNPETLQRVLPEMSRIWNGKVGFVPGSAAAEGGADLFAPSRAEEPRSAVDPAKGFVPTKPVVVIKNSKATTVSVAPTTVIGARDVVPLPQHGN